MGDLVELHHDKIFYKFTSQSVVFSVKGNLGTATLALADQIGFDYIDHWVFIDKDGQTGVNVKNAVIVQTSTPGILEGDKFHKFWLTWFEGKIEMGKFGESKPICSTKIEKYNIKFVTFFGRNESNILHWKVIIPPNIQRPILKPIAGGKPHWVPYDGELPYGAFIGGYENENLYIMRTQEAGLLTVGKFVPSLKCGIIAENGQLRIKSNFEILCAHDCIWIPTKESTVPAGAISVRNSHEFTYIGQVKHDEHKIPGKVPPNDLNCYFAYQGEELFQRSFDILVAPYSNPRCANSAEDTYGGCLEDYEDDDDDDDDNDDENNYINDFD